jgi:hypothetical protein
MRRDKDYWEIIADHIAAIVKRREIEEVLHFTPLVHLPRILEHGLLSRSELQNVDYDVYVSEANGRRDGEDGAVSVSISCYYPKMFDARRYRAGGMIPFVILVLRPSLLWNYPCRFYGKGVTTNAMKYERGKRNGGYALEKLFEDFPVPMMDNPAGKSFRDEYGLPPSWPTFADSEVQVMNSIDPNVIIGAWVETPEHREFAQAAFNSAGRKECKVVVQSFGPRICRKPYSWG